MTHREEGIMQYNPSDFVEINPATAAGMGISGGDPVRIESRRGETVVPAQITDRVGPENVFVPIHFTESAINRLTDEEHLDPTAATPEYKVSAVRVEPADADALDVDIDTGQEAMSQSLSGDDRTSMSTGDD
jgi:formate dehydrogenase major subunit